MKLDEARELDADLDLVMLAMAGAILMVWLARSRVSAIGRELEAARAGRERAQQEAGSYRSKLDGALDELHKVAGERDDALRGGEEPSVE